MELNNDSLPTTSIRGYARFLTNTTTTSFASSDINGFVNDYYHQLTAKILSAMDEWDFGGEIATADLVANQREYTFPTDLLKIKRIDLCLDGTNWVRAESMDPQEVSYSLASESDITDHFDNNSPFYDILDNSIYIYSGTIIAVTAGIKIWYDELVTELSADSDTPVIAKSGHSLLAEYPALMYFRKFQYDDKAKTTLLSISQKENDLINYYARRQADRVMKMKPLMGSADYK